MALLRRMGDWLYRRPYLLLSIAFLAWAVNIVIGRYVAGHIPPIGLTFWRWGVAFLLLLPFTFTHLKRDWPAIRGNIVLLTVLAVTGIPAFNALSYWGLQYTEAINGLLIQSISPLAVGLWALALFGDRLTWTQIGGIAASFVGVVIILCRGDRDVLHAINFNPGDIICIAGMLCFTFYSAMLKKRPKMHPMSFVTFTIGWGTFLLLPFYVWEMLQGRFVPFDPATILIVVYVAVFASIVAMVCYNRGIEIVGPNRGAALYPLIVVYGAAIAIVFLGERPQWFHAVGFVLVFAGVIVATREPR